MSGTEIILWLGLVALLGSYLCLKHRQRVRSHYERYESAEWTGKAIDVTELKPKVEEVRRNYLEARQPVKSPCFHRALIELARQAVARLAYFHDRVPEEHAQTRSS
jgi:hypothetical protein